MKAFVTYRRQSVKVYLMASMLFVFSLTIQAQEPEEVEPQDAGIETQVDFGEEDILRTAEERDAEWQRWMGIDEYGVRTYWFRRSFTIEDPPAGGAIYITADDDYSLYLNGRYIASDETDEIDWQRVKDYDIGDFLIIGENIIAIQVDDVDNTRQGLMFAMTYHTIPDIETQLDRMVEQELAGQEARRQERQMRQQAAQQLRESRREPPTAEELKEMRAIEKNKLD